jgi:transposase-like protein
MGTRPAIFKRRQTEPGIILCAVRWYLCYSLSLRDVEELLEGIAVGAASCSIQSYLLPQSIMLA